MEIDMTNTVHVGWLFGAFALGFALPLVSYLMVIFMIGNTLRRSLSEIRDILNDLRDSTPDLAFMSEQCFARIKKYNLVGFDDDCDKEQASIPTDCSINCFDFSETSPKEGEV